MRKRSLLLLVLCSSPGLVQPSGRTSDDPLRGVRSFLESDQAQRVTDLVAQADGMYMRDVNSMRNDVTLLLQLAKELVSLGQRELASEVRHPYF